MTRRQTEVNKQQAGFQRMMLIFAAVVLIVLAAGGYFVYQSTKNTTQLVQTISNQMASIQQLQNNQAHIPSAAELQEVVAAAINNIAAEEQQRIVQAKEAAYQAAEEVVPDGKHIYGNLNARFTLVEFSDLECPYCKRFHDTPKQLVDGSNGNVNWEWMHLPLSFHNPAAQYGAEAAECAAELGGNRAFWMYIDEFFVQTRGNGQGPADLAQVAEDVGVDVNAFRECMQSGRHRNKVQEHVNKAQKLGITGTPATFVVDNTTGESQLLGGAQPAEAFVAAMRKLMAESQEQ